LFINLKEEDTSTWSSTHHIHEYTYP